MFSKLFGKTSHEKLEDFLGQLMLDVTPEYENFIQMCIKDPEKSKFIAPVFPSVDRFSRLKDAQRPAKLTDAGIKQFSTNLPPSISATIKKMDETAIAQAFQLLVKMSGQQDAAVNPQLVEVLRWAFYHETSNRGLF